MRRFQNLHLADRSLFLQYKNLFPTDFDAARELLSESQLSTKIYRAVDVNADTAAIKEIEDYYFENIPQKLDELLTQFNIDIKAVKYVGEYENSVNYYANNVVSYNYDLYFCKINKGTFITGVLPTNTNSWVALGLRGEQGAFGSSIRLAGEWTPDTTYNILRLVSHNDRLYVSIRTTREEPPSSSWINFLYYDRSKINFYSSDLTIGDIYWVNADGTEPERVETSEPNPQPPQQIEPEPEPEQPEDNEEILSDTIAQIEIVDEYPEVEEENVLYLLTES